MSTQIKKKAGLSGDVSIHQSDHSRAELKKIAGNALEKTHPITLLNSDDFEVVEQIETNELELDVSRKIPSGEKFTRISVVKEGNEVEEVSEEQMREIIRNSKDEINKIIIEQVRHKSADRVSFLIGDDHKSEKSKNPKNQLPPGPESTRKEIPILRIHSQDEMKSAGQGLKALNQDEILTLELRMNEWFFDEAEGVEKSLKTNNFEESLALLKNQDLSNEQNENADFIYQKQIYVRKNGRKGTKYFYQAKNHLELYNVGKKYQEDLQNGVKNFALFGHHLREDREKASFGLYAFFNYEHDTKITIFTHTMDGSFYFRYLEDLKVEKKFLKDEDIGIDVYRTDNLEIIEFASVLQVIKKLKRYSIESFLEEFLKESKIIIWDLPEVEVMDQSKELYFPVIRQIENVSILVGENFTQSRDLNSTIMYFKKYGIPIKGILIAKNRSKKDKLAA